jgi:hypothetical protein
LSLAIYAIPLLIVAYLVIKQAIKAPIRTWVPLLVFFGVFLLLHGVNELIGPDSIMGLIYMAGSGNRTSEAASAPAARPCAETKPARQRASRFRTK